MPTVEDIKKLLEDFMLDSDIPFRELKPYLLSEFEWDNIDKALNFQFLIRNIPIEDNMIVSDILKSYLPVEKIIAQQ